MPSPRLFLSKLRRMTLAELTHRIGATGRTAIEAQLYRAGFGTDPAPNLGQTGPPSYLYPFFANAHLVQVSEQLAADGAYVARLRAEADALLRGEFSFFGTEFRLPASRIPWTSDPVSGRSWPMVFHTEVDIFSGNVGHGDVKFVWELNRHQFLPTLGKAWRLTGDGRYAETALAWVDDWIAANPYKVGINWASALEVAVRALAWLWMAGLLETAPAFTGERRARLQRALYQHATYLNSHLSFYFSPYNHLIGEATALHAIGALVPSLAHARRWRDRGWQILCDEVAKQFHRDGGTVEQAFGYHHFTLGFYMQSLLIAERQEQVVPPAVTDRLAAAWRYSAAVTRPDGLVPMVGDADEGKALALEQNHLWDFRSYQAVGAAVLGDAALAAAAGGCPPDARWVTGPRGWPVPSTTAQSDAPLQWLDSSGYVVMRDTDRGDWTMLDVGDIAHGVPEDEEVSAAHGHADLLAFELMLAGAPRLIDPGFVTYNGPVEWHRHFRDTQAHNALVVDDQSQARYRGRLKWSHGASARLVRALTGDDFAYVEGTHDAYARGDAPVSHARGMLWVRPGVWIVLDWLTGTGTHVVDRYFHFAPGHVTDHVRGARAAEVNGVALRVECLEAEAECRLTSGEATPDGGWVATRYEQKAPAAVLRCRVRRNVPTVLATLLAADGTQPGPRWADPRTGPRLEWSDGSALLLAAGAAAGVPDLETDARCAALLLAPSGVTRAAMVVGGTRLVWQGRSLYTAPTSTDALLRSAGGPLSPVPIHVLR